MNTYEIKFIGREKNAIGIFYKIVEIVNAVNTDTARTKLYEKYEHILIKNIKKL